MRINRSGTSRDTGRLARLAFVIPLATLAIACAPEREDGEVDSPAAMPPANAAPRQSQVPPREAESAPGAALTAAEVAAGAGAQAGGAEAVLIARGDSIFHGRAGGAICVTCHGQDGKGLPNLGPDLTDGKWLHGDGSQSFVETIIKTGVTKPKVSATVMPPMGGVPLDAGQVRAVATYVRSLGPR